MAMWALTRRFARSSHLLRCRLASQVAVVSPASASAEKVSGSAVPAEAAPDVCLTPSTDRGKLYWKLAKGKLTVWVALSALPGYFLALPGAVDPFVLAALTTGTFLTSASAQSMNQMLEIDRDAKMKRTAQRPLPSGQMSVQEAARFAALSGSVGLGILSVGASPATAAVAAATMATYAGLYTPMKVLSPYNTHVGAISGALPTLLGFTAALGSGLVASPWAAHAAWLFLMQTLWQMPHFYALAWLHRADYLNGGYKMFPLTDSTGLETAAMSKPYLVALCALPWAMSAAGVASWMLPVGALLPSALWWRSLQAFECKPSPSTCRRFFLGSLSYLLSMLALVTAFSRAEKTPEEPGTRDGEVADQPATSEVLEPAWRAKMHNYLYDACPHEQLRYVLFGARGVSCPFHREV